MNSAFTTGRATAFAVAITALSAGPGLPAGFPLAPGLKPCKPLSASKEVLCEWHNVDTHAAYLFYTTALPKAGYTILKGAAEVRSPREFGAIGFTKGTLKGAVSMSGMDLTIQVIDEATK